MERKYFIIKLNNYRRLACKSDRCTWEIRGEGDSRENEKIERPANKMDEEQQQQRSRWGCSRLCHKTELLTRCIILHYVFLFLIQRAFNSWSVGVVPFTLHAQHTFLWLASPHSMNDDERCWFKLLSLKNLCMVPNWIVDFVCMCVVRVCYSAVNELIV